MQFASSFGVSQLFQQLAGSVLVLLPRIKNVHLAAPYLLKAAAGAPIASLLNYLLSNGTAHTLFRVVALALRIKWKASSTSIVGSCVSRGC